MLIYILHFEKQKDLTDEDKPVTLKQEILDKLGALLIAAFGLVAALAWNDAIKAVFKEIFGDSSTVVPMLIYASMVTVIAVILIILVARTIANSKNR
ncbi:MAG: hypothetical protein GKS07_01710 [Nitrosopumilus sp.]|nr:MAG: hypothetical protein GKS07_01710 [Nitrosopumilus sp.]